jgi:glycogen debranching enzyme
VEEAARWTKQQVDWLVRSVPERGTGLGAGLPEYPWWFGCDNFYALPAANTFGLHDLARSTLTLLGASSTAVNGDGRIIHEQSTTGHVYNPGNAQESPQFCHAVWDTYCWTGDREWLSAMMPHVERAMEWVLSQDASGRDLAPGYGIIEIAGLDARLLDTAVHTAMGLKDWAAMLRVFGDDGRAAAIERRAARLVQRIIALYWIPEAGVFGDLLAPPEWIADRRQQWSEWARERGRAEAAERYRRLPAYDRPGGEQVLQMGNWIINAPMEAGIAPPALAERALEAMRGPAYRGPHGLYLSASEQEEAMTISTGAQAVAEMQYGHPDVALGWMEQIARALSLRMPGSISEMSPDYGCFVQAWTAYGFWFPLVRGFFGLHPNGDRRIHLTPSMPTAWDHAALEHLAVGTNHLVVRFERRQDTELYTVVTDEPWTVALGPFLHASQVQKGRETAPDIWDLDTGGRLTVVRPVVSGA